MNESEITNPQNNRAHSVAEILNQFQRSVKPSVWIHVTKELFLSELQANLAHPSKIFASGIAFSGEVSLTFALIQRNPIHYMTICIDLFETGAFRVGDYLVEPPVELRKFHVPVTMRSVDWVLVASLKHSSIPFEGNAGAILSTPSGLEILRLCTTAQILFPSAKVEFDPIAVSGALEALYKAKQTVQRGGSAIMHVNHSLLNGRKKRSSQDTQWITFLNVVSESNELPSPDDIFFHLHFYGDGKRSSIRISRIEFEQNLLGVLYITSA